jgi:prepilin-type N-terminal cleavage/methylation domain-containing protein/prepilin-type processing-associated H-X9-DG protein
MDRKELSMCATNCVALRPGRVGVRRGLGFTLVELLVVIGIIALLIAILLPSLQGARRSANSIKCQASLRQVGIAFKMYADEHKNAYPVAVHFPGDPRFPKFTIERRWYDLVAKYISKEMAAATDLEKVREKSVLWGCPEWKTKEDSSDWANDKYRPGYGMNYYAPRFFQTGDLVNDYAYISGTGRGNYLKQNRWSGREMARNSSEVGIIIDSMTHIVNVPGYSSYPYSMVQSGGWQPGPAASPYTNGGAAFYVDASRHVRRGIPVTDKVKGMNMLFIDGHVAPVSVRDAWAAITGKQAP